MTTRPDPIDFPCPKCKVDADQDCKVWAVNGTEMDAMNGRYHSERVRLANHFLVMPVQRKRP